jgi:hypothetical protein
MTPNHAMHPTGAACTKTESTMKYMLLPLNEHVDDGLGATGEAFEESATLLSSSSENISHSHYQIPLCFLYRHAIELYLKSAIVVAYWVLSQLSP